jgi:hypothetical protein
MQDDFKEMRWPGTRFPLTVGQGWVTISAQLAKYSELRFAAYISGGMGSLCVHIPPYKRQAPS